MATAPPPVQLTDLAGSLKRHWPVIVAAALVGLVLGALVSVVIPDRYVATATVSVDPMNADPLGSSADAAGSVSMSTEAGIVRSAKVAAAASKALAPDEAISAAEVAQSTAVDSPDDSLILSIDFTGDSADQATAGATAVAEAYLAARRSDATASIAQLVAAAQKQVAAVQAASAQPANAGPFAQRSLGVQADALGSKLAELGNVDLDPGQIISDGDTTASRSTPGLAPLGVAGLFLGLLAGIPIALLRKDENSDIGGVEGLQAIGDQIVLDGTKDINRADTWDIAAFMLKIPTDIDGEDPFLIMVDAQESPGQSTNPGQELVDALARRGRSARFVDAGAINEGKISRGWPTERKRESWAGEIIVIDTTMLTSDANKVALATRSDSVLLARSTTDDVTALRRLSGLLGSKGVDIALTALFPTRAEMVSGHR